MAALKGKTKPIPVKIVNSNTLSVPGTPDYKPTMSFDVPVSMDLPKLGAKVRVAVSGKVVRVEKTASRWDGGKKRAHLEIEYAGPQAVHVEDGTSLEALEAEDAEL
jgi:hypothetical protein